MMEQNMVHLYASKRDHEKAEQLDSIEKKAENLVDVNYVKQCIITIKPLIGGDVTPGDQEKVIKKLREITSVADIELNGHSKKMILELSISKKVEINIHDVKPGSASIFDLDDVQDIQVKIVNDKSFPEDLFEDIAIYPSSIWEQKFNNLVGLDDKKESIKNIISTWVDIERLKTWSKHHYNGTILQPVKTLFEMTPFFVFDGDVGCGKTALAKSMGSAISNNIKRSCYLFQLSKTIRGEGLVGQMTKNIINALNAVYEFALSSGDVTILFIDEADSLMSSRTGERMHHEDRAGVNAFIEMIDSYQNEHAKVIVVATTNLGEKLDEAVRRRAQHIWEFTRPEHKDVIQLLKKQLGSNSFCEEEMEKFATLLEGYSFSDIVQRVLPYTVIEASAQNLPLNGEILEKAIERIKKSKAIK